MVGITCYDGVNCIGGNKILLEDGGSKLFFDFGKNFSAEGDYYEEFLQPKSCAGLYEKMQLGLLPAFRDLYRPDLVTWLCDPWMGLEGDEIGDVGGVLVSHAHVDHMGAVHELRGDIPIYCSPMTAAVCRALQDTGKSASDAEYCYYVCRTEKEGGELCTPHFKTHPFAGRKYHLTDSELPEGFKRFWANVPGSRVLEALDYEHATTCAGLPIRGFAVDHSVFGACAWAVETSAGWVVYSGDLRMHGGYGGLTHRFVEEAAKLEPVAMLIEGTRIDKERSCTEGDVRESCMDAVKACGGLVVADFGPRNVERLISFLEVARESGRELAILPKDAYLLDAMRAAGGEQEVPKLEESGIRIYWEYQSTEGAWRKHVKERHPDLGIGPPEVHAGQDKYVCCFSFWDANEIAYIGPVAGSVWIYSSCEAFNEEMKFSGERLQHWIDKFGMRRVGRLLDNDSNDDPFHASGHASGPDLLDIVRTIRPKTLIPVHTTKPDIYAQQVGDICSVRIPEKGVPIEL